MHKIGKKSTVLGTQTGHLMIKQLINRKEISLIKKNLLSLLIS